MVCDYFFFIYAKETKQYLVPAEEPDPRHDLKSGPAISGFQTPDPCGIQKKVLIPLYRGKKQIPESLCAQPRSSSQEESIKMEVSLKNLWLLGAGKQGCTHTSVSLGSTAGNHLLGGDTPLCSLEDLRRVCSFAVKKGGQRCYSSCTTEPDPGDSSALSGMRNAVKKS